MQHRCAVVLRLRGWILAGLNAQKDESVQVAIERLSADVQRYANCCSPIGGKLMGDFLKIAIPTKFCIAPPWALSSIRL